MERTFKLEIITPYRIFYSGSAEMLIVNTSDGELGILADHEPCVASVHIGAARILIDGVWKVASFSEGFLEMEGNRVTVLVGAAEWPEEIDVARAERALSRANERIRENSVPLITRRSEVAARRAKTRLKIAALVQKE